MCWHCAMRSLRLSTLRLRGAARSTNISTCAALGLCSNPVHIFSIVLKKLHLLLFLNCSCFSTTRLTLQPTLHCHSHTPVLFMSTLLLRYFIEMPPFHTMCVVFITDAISSQLLAQHMQIQIHTHTHACIHAWIHTYVDAYIRRYIPRGHLASLCAAWCVRVCSK